MLNYTDIYNTGSFRQAIKFHSSHIRSKLKALSDASTAHEVFIALPQGTKLVTEIYFQGHQVVDNVEFDYLGSRVQGLLEDSGEAQVSLTSNDENNDLLLQQTNAR